MKIVILDGYTLNPGDLSWDGLKQFGEVTLHDRSPVDIGVLTTGYYVVDTHAAREKGIQ